MDSSGNVFVTGNSYHSGVVDSDYATVAYSNAGVPLWTNRYSNPVAGIDDTVRAMAVDTGGNVFVTGNSGTIKYSSSVPPPRLDFQKPNNQLVLSWTNAGFNLQTAPAVTGPFTNLPAATSPYTNSLTARNNSSGSKRNETAARWPLVARKNPNNNDGKMKTQQTRMRLGLALTN